MSELDTFRDWCATRADWQAGDARTACRGFTAFGVPKPPDHANCGGHRCGCRCHEPTDADRKLFRTLAAEIDAYRAADPDVAPAATADDVALFGAEEDE